MAIKPTKQRIINAAITLYNVQGVNNTTLKHIADSVGMSVGNLAYHFSNHEHIIEEVYRQLDVERQQMFQNMQNSPSFENINSLIVPLLKLAQKYIFIQLDGPHILRNYPDIAEFQRQFYENSIMFVNVVMQLSVELGNIKPEQVPNQYRRIGHTLWMIMTFWCVQHVLRKQDMADIDFEEARQTVWSLLMPHLTPKGLYLLQELTATADKL